MSDRIGEDALLDVGCCLDRFEVDNVQCLSWKSHTYLASKSHILPVRLLQEAKIGGFRSFVSARNHTRGIVSFDGAQPDALQLELAAIKDSDLEKLTLMDPVGHALTEEEVAQIAVVAATVKVTDLRLYGRLTHLSPPALHLLLFSFSAVEELTLHKFNGSQLTDEHLRECGRRKIWRLNFTTQTADAGPVAFSDEALLDYLYAPQRRDVVLSAFSASPQFVQKLVSRARTATDLRQAFLEVDHLPLASQQLGGLHLTEDHGVARHSEQLENGARLSLEFGRGPVPPGRSDDKFYFFLWEKSS